MAYFYQIPLSLKLVVSFLIFCFFILSFLSFFHFFRFFRRFRLFLFHFFRFFLLFFTNSSPLLSSFIFFNVVKTQLLELVSLVPLWNFKIIYAFLLLTAFLLFLPLFSLHIFIKIIINVLLIIITYNMVLVKELT